MPKPLSLCNKVQSINQLIFAPAPPPPNRICTGRPIRSRIAPHLDEGRMYWERSRTSITLVNEEFSLSLSPQPLSPFSPPPLSLSLSPPSLSPPLPPSLPPSLSYPAPAQTSLILSPACRLHSCIFFFSLSAIFPIKTENYLSKILCFKG